VELTSNVGEVSLVRSSSLAIPLSLPACKSGAPGEEGEAVSKHVNKITYIEFLEQSPAEKILVERTSKDPKSNFLLNHVTTAIKGNKMVESIVVKDRKTNEEKEIKVEGVFIYIGWLPN